MMGFFMPCWKNNNPRTIGSALACGRAAGVARCGFWRFIAAGLLLLMAQGALASSALITDAHAEIREDIVYLDVDLQISFNAEMIDAMRNAIPLNFTLQAVIDEPRDWWLARTLASDDRHYRLEYHALSQTWLVTDVLEHEARSYSTLDGALRSLQRVRAWPISSVRNLAGQAHLVGRVRMVLDVNKLPLPLRFPALFDSRWALNSEWFLWSVPRS
jgi:hypothetical protein